MLQSEDAFKNNAINSFYISINNMWKTENPKS